MLLSMGVRFPPLASSGGLCYAECLQSFVRERDIEFPGAQAEIVTRGKSTLQNLTWIMSQIVG